MKKILFIQTAFPGDAILSLPALEKLKAMNDQSHISVLCIPSTKDIFECAPYVDEVLVFDKKGKNRSLNSTLKFAKQLKRMKFDLIYSSHRSLRTSLLVLFSEVQDTYGFSNSAVKYIYKNLVEYKLDQHEVQRNLNLVGFHYEGENWRIRPKLKLSDEKKAYVQSFLSQIQKNNIIAIAPGSIWATKRYPLDKWKNIIDYFTEKDFTILLIGGKEDVNICNSLAENNNDKVINCAGRFSIPESIELLSYCSVLISNDSAPTHMGMAAGIRVLTIYCSTIPEFGFYPYLEGSRFLSYNNLNCKPCGIHGHRTCPLDHFNCAKKLSETEVIKVIEEMISEKRSN